MIAWVGFLGTVYLWVVAVHVIFVMFLIAALFMMPRYFVYHQESLAGSAEEARWVDREDKLRRIILNPSLIIVWVLGLVLVVHGGYWMSGWMHAKFALVITLTGYHGWIIGYARRLKRGERRLTGKQLRLLNEVPGLLMIPIVILVFVKPF